MILMSKTVSVTARATRSSFRVIISLVLPA
jgi:hypothetical protein